MKKYWLFGIVFLSILFVSSTIIHSAVASDTSGLNDSFESDRPTINPTEYILHLTGRPSRPPAPSTVRSHTELPKIDPTKYVLYLTQYPRKPSGEPEHRPIGSVSGNLLDRLEGEKDRLKDDKLQRCISLSKNVTSRSLNLVKTVTTMAQKFTAILTSIEKYYTQKIVPTGVTLSNYDALISDIAVRGNAVSPLLEKAQSDATGFSCTGSSPSAQLKQFSGDVQAVIHALQEYRTGIKNLIQAIKGLHIPEPSETPTASSSPTVIPTNSQ